MLQSTKDALRAIVGADPTLPDETKESWRKAIAAGEAPRAEATIPRMVSHAEAKKLLGVSRQTLGRYARSGLLTRVKTCGGGRSRGYSFESVRALLEGRNAAARLDAAGKGGAA